MKDIILIAHNLRSTYNVGSLLRTAEGLGLKEIWLTGYTPYPEIANDSRLPHIAKKMTEQIHKTALGAETFLKVEHSDTIEPLLIELKSSGYHLLGLEQDKRAINIVTFNSPNNVALIVGREVEGIETEVLNLCDQILQIPMLGKKESFNVAQACAMALYQVRFKK